MTDEEMITKMLTLAQPYVDTLDHNKACHFRKKLAGIIIGRGLAAIDKATAPVTYAKEDMQKFRELVDDEADFYYQQAMRE